MPHKLVESHLQIHNAVPLFLEYPYRNTRTSAYLDSSPYTRVAQSPTYQCHRRDPTVETIRHCPFAFPSMAHPHSEYGPCALTPSRNPTAGVCAGVPACLLPDLSPSLFLYTPRCPRLSSSSPPTNTSNFQINQQFNYFHNTNKPTPSR
jgi:hypothetical protein